MRLKRNSFGAIAAEAAIVIPLLAGVIFCTIEFGRIYFYKNSLSHIARMSARYVSVGPQYTDANLKTLTKADKIFPDTSVLTLTISPTTNASRNIGDLVTVTATIPYEAIFPDFVRVFTGGDSNMWPTSLSASSINRVEIVP